MHQYMTHFSTSFNVNIIKDTGSPIGFPFFIADYSSFGPMSELGDATTVFCSCLVCSVSENTLEKQFTMNFPSVSFVMIFWHDKKNKLI